MRQRSHCHLGRMARLDRRGPLDRWEPLDRWASLERPGPLDRWASLERPGPLDRWALLERPGPWDRWALLERPGRLDRWAPPDPGLCREGSSAPPIDLIGLRPSAIQGQVWVSKQLRLRVTASGAVRPSDRSAPECVESARG